ncbi:MAG: DNA repair protein RadC [Clostridia bacterium]|nr:DNA repair protein RadC [Clostridia bacterium]
MAGEHAGHRQRMRERFVSQGLDGFAPHEVLELILMYAIPQKNVNPLAHRLLEHFGSLHAVLEADAEELVRVEGIGSYAASLLSLFGHVDRQLEKSRSAEKKRLGSRAAAKAHCAGLLKGLRQEHLYLVCLNAQMEVIHNALIARGTLNEVPAYPRLVAEAALRCNAHSVVLCHNHPGGSVIPSMQDLQMTADLGDMLHSLDILLADHVIVAGEDALSLVECGLLQHEQQDGTVLSRVADPGGELLIRNYVLQKLQKGKK